MKLFKPASLWVILTVVPGLSHAYVGPGVGLSALGSILAFIGAIFLMIVGFLWYPIKRLIKRKSADSEGGDSPPKDDSHP
jgi:Kef-type K+ transport system membrane component KefB